MYSPLIKQFSVSLRPGKSANYKNNVRPSYTYGINYKTHIILNTTLVDLPQAVHVKEKFHVSACHEEVT